MFQSDFQSVKYMDEKKERSRSRIPKKGSKFQCQNRKEKSMPAAWRELSKFCTPLPVRT